MPAPPGKMRLLSWNCRGIGGTLAVQELRTLIRERDPQVIFLSETKSSRKVIDNLKYSFNLFGISVDARGKSGGLALFWKKSVMLNVRSFSNRFIDAVVCENRVYWRLTGIYGEPDINKRQLWWSNFADLGKQSSLPWVCLGDFNEVLRRNEVRGGRERPYSCIRNFRNALEACGLTDVQHEGYPYTWSRNWKFGDSCKAKLDRVCVNGGLRSLFPYLKVYHLFSIHSDHVPILVLIEKSKPGAGGSVFRKKEKFRFEYMWLEDEECGKIVREAWNSVSSEENSSYLCKSECCKKMLDQWSRSKFGNVGKEIKRLKKEIEALRCCEPREDHSEVLNILHQELETRLNQEDRLWRQRAKEHWLRDADRNTTYFHAKASAKYRKKTIRGLYTNEGIWTTDMNKVTSRVSRKLSDSAKVLLQAPFTIDDVEAALKSMKPLKSPGPDGLPPVFFQKFWRDIKGQEVNYEKSAVVFSQNTPQPVREENVRKLGIKEVEAHDKYLGLPSVCGKKKREVFASLRERIWGRIQGWDEKTLSKAGKEILIKAVLQAIPSYAMSVFKLPDGLIKEIQAMIIEFWWNKKNGSRSIHWASMDALFDRKSDGGMGFRDLKAFNLALLGKQVWRLMENSDSLYYKVFKARYFPNTNVLEAEMGFHPSFAWRSLCEAKNKLRRGFGWRIANGEKVRILFDAWLINERSFKIIYSSDVFTKDDRVQKLISPETGTWNASLIVQTFPVEDAKMILNIPLSESDCSDEYCWAYTKNKCYSVRSGYHFLRAEGKLSKPATSTAALMPLLSNVKWSLMWKLKIMEKVKIFLWRLCRNALPTSENLRIRGVYVDGKCVWCDNESPGLKHLFYECHFARQVWALSWLTSKICMYESECVKTWVIRLVSDLQNSDAEYFAVLLWCLWHARNKKIFEEEIMNPMSIVSVGSKHLEEFRKANLSILEDMMVCRDVAVWRPPNVGTIKVNFDAACSKERNKGGIGMIARDGLANFLAAKSIAIHFCWQSDDMEALALQKTVEWIIESGFENVMIEGDSINVISLLSKQREDRSPMAVMVQNARRKLDHVCIWSADWVRRSANEAAHLLAKHGLDMVNDVCYFDVPPDWIIQTIVSDSI